jgi:acyl-CoA thioester hydrolase
MDGQKIADIPTPFEASHVIVRPEWVDYNGHMNVGYYPVAFDLGFDHVYGFLGVGGADIGRTGISTFVAETHFTYQRELNQGDRLRITTHLLGHDAKRLHVFQHMYHAGEGYLAATGEWLILCVELRQRKVIAMPAWLHERVQRVCAAHKNLPRPPEVGRSVSLSAGRPR